MKALKHCPFCNSDEGLIRKSPWDKIEGKKDTHYVVECYICGAIGPEGKTQISATYKWNRLLSTIEDNLEFKEALNESRDLVEFPGLEREAEIFYPFKIEAVKRDPENYNVYLMLIEFTTGSRYKGRFGLCIYDIDQKKFIEEPGDLDDYDTTPEELYNKYRFIIPGYEELDEDAMGGVSAPMATLNNTPGVGNAVPASATTVGSGDLWSTNKKPYTQGGKVKNKKKKKKKINKQLEENNINPYDKIGMDMAKKMKVKPPFKKKKGASRSAGVVQQKFEHEIISLSQFIKLNEEKKIMKLLRRYSIKNKE
ncbi:MAG TPA: Lar family restriction alleviation protein [Candidatus Paceibacterota bacterium]|nr:Lar family restriction alleviation protein [Candidatus Paceibacterota bacterium]